MAPLQLRPSLLVLAAVAALLAFGLVRVHSQGDLQVGYAVLAPSAGSAPVASALFSSTTPDGTLVWEAGVGAVAPAARGRVFVDQQQGTRTALALANISASDVEAELTLRDEQGGVRAQRTELFQAGLQRALFLDELFAEAQGLRGSLAFEADGELAAVTLRQNTNVLGEAIFATLPVLDPDLPVSTDPVVFAHVGAGEGLGTQIILINGSAEPVGGQIEFYDDDGLPLEVELGGAAGTSFAWQIEGDGTWREELTRAAGVAVGWARVTLAEGSRSPDGVAIFQFRSGEEVISEAGVAAVRATRRARLFVDQNGTSTGVAVANPGDSPATLTLRLLSGGGAELETRTRNVAARGHVAAFADKLFESAAAGFSGLMEISSDVEIVPVTLKLTTNGRGHPILTTLPVADLERPPAGTLVVPHLGFGDFGSGVFATRLILINADTAASASGTLRFHSTDGTALVVPLGGETASEFDYQVAAGGGNQLRPGVELEAGPPALILLDEKGSSEVAVNEGGTAQLEPVVLDAQGIRVTDASLSYSSLTPEVAGVDSTGLVTGHEAGFSTLTISAADAVTTATITVVRVSSAASGFDVRGVAGDVAGRVYLANAGGHTILRAEDPESQPQLYAGIENAPGLVNDERLRARFNEPSFLALDQASGALYVSDGANHVIRLVEPGPGGRARTFAGTGEPGVQDGALDQAGFNNPQGIALDHRGSLWVADSGNHTIRRIDLVARTVTTVAGLAGQAGFVDGSGDAARFNGPIGVAAHRESLAEQLARESRQEAPPEASVIVADTGNGVLRLVSESGLVQTLSAASLASAAASLQFQGVPLVFDLPTGVAEDCAGNIYVTDPRGGQVNVLLGSLGKLAQIAGARTFGRPVGVDSVDCGEVRVGDGDRLHNVIFAPPEIVSITPDSVRNEGGQRLTIRGRNFAPETLLAIFKEIIVGVERVDTETLSVVLPPLPSGILTLTVQHRGGLAQAKLPVEPTPVEELPSGFITTVAGGISFVGDGGPADQAQLDRPQYLATGPDGTLHVADTDHNRVRRIDLKTGIINTVAGSGEGGGGVVPDNELAITAKIPFPQLVDLDGAGNLYLSFGGGVFKVESATGIIRWLRDVPHVAGMAADVAGNIYLSRQFDHQIRRWDAVSGEVTTLAGTGQAGFSGDDGPALEAQMNEPRGVAIDTSGNVFFADSNNNRVRKIDVDTGGITTVAGSGFSFGAVDGGPALAGPVFEPEWISFDSDGNLYIVARNGVLRVDAVAGTMTEVPTPEATAAVPGAAGQLFVANGDLIYQVDIPSGETAVVAGGFQPDSGDGGAAIFAPVTDPQGIAIGPEGDIVIAEQLGRRIRKISARTGQISTLAGDGNLGTPRDGELAVETSLFDPTHVDVDGSGNVYFEDFDIFKIENGIIRRLVDFTCCIVGLAVGPGEDVFFSTSGNQVQRYQAASGQLAVIAGDGRSGVAGDGGPATEASLDPLGLALDSRGELYVADWLNGRVRRIDRSGIITTVAGGGDRFLDTFTSPDLTLAATEVNLSTVVDVALDRDERLYVAQPSAIYQVNLQAGTIRIMAAKGFFADPANPPPPPPRDNLPAVESLFSLRQMAVDGLGNLYFTDGWDLEAARIRAIRRPE